MAPSKKPAMKAMKPMKTSKIGSKISVFKGTKEKTTSGLKKSDYIKNKNGKIVSKKKSALAKQNYGSSALKAWANAVKAARKSLGVTGFVAIGGKSPEGKALYAKAKSLL
ncbi:Dinoflagellate/viral nucleoprotein (DVNP) [Amphidinium carterae]|mmetsp:Transcript_8542/g.11913  ORF Transcript_8542/g.11913 Transcript_8542/m.11913 type:complete len:110 (+) Transcript_8542:99-428(+)